MRDLRIRRSDPRDARIVDVDPAPLPDGAARLRLDLFALTSNNVTYAAMGEGALGYWDFFPAPDGWGRPPVWGFATVIESRVAAVPVGARVYGYFPVGETLDVQPAKAGAHGFVDGAPHRAAKAPIYNQYLYTAADPAYDAGFEPEQALFQPLYATGWWAADCIHRGPPSPRTVVISSASAKTALSTAQRLRQLADAELVALTSASNQAYVAGTGLYGRTLPYEAAASLAADGPAVYVDFLGRAALTATVHRALGAGLVRSLAIGATDWADRAGGARPPGALEGPKPEFFFVPSYAAARLKDDAGLAAAMLGDLRGFYAASRAYVTARRLHGADAILDAWARLAAGRVSPREGLVPAF